MISLAEKNQCLDIARGVKVFNEKEVAVVEEVLNSYSGSPEKDYFVSTIKKDAKIAGFLIFGPAALTDYAWDIYWLLVDKNWQGKGVGRQMLSEMETFILKRQEKAVLRIETSAGLEYLRARNLYQKHGFREVGRIPNFYRQEDALLIFYKEISRSGVSKG